MKAFYTVLCVHMCVRFKALPDDSYYQNHVAQSAECIASFAINTQKHTETHTLCSVLHWQAVIPALAYERRQLEGVAVTVVVACCLLCYPFGWQLLCSC